MQMCSRQPCPGLFVATCGNGWHPVPLGVVDSLGSDPRPPPDCSDRSPLSGQKTDGMRTTHTQRVTCQLEHAEPVRAGLNGPLHPGARIVRQQRNGDDPSFGGPELALTATLTPSSADVLLMNPLNGTVGLMGLPVAL